ncbi:fumarylacetoacetate hydrolase family protein [Phytoactinopolyspora halotolerans]|uniref:Fumarylacetoacetate hydrolase family protein n=1 Tax=Phytoactinopolyspora halotolerans TaxID=1981512 RepID=A0A6L9S2M4_9ACTN|nr:fumarylacetoacetate hydrolase family protein [Phytoactinopolyspora halotolerans]
MQLLRLGELGHERPAVRTDDGSIFDLSSITPDIDGTFLAQNGIARARAGVESDSLPVVDTEGVRIGAPIARPGKVVCVGLNYSDHAAESGLDVPTEPVIFMKAPNTVVGPNDEVLIPRGSTKTDWEVELGVVVGQTGRYLESPEAAAEIIAGYVVSHDVSEREFQLERGGTWDKGKSCETFNPIGPWLVPADEVPDAGKLRLRLWVNGQLRQDGNTENLIFGIGHIVWYLSQFMVLEPGDVINTGTPAGVAMGMAGQPYLRAGDVVELEIDGLGKQRQQLAQA